MIKNHIRIKDLELFRIQKEFPKEFYYKPLMYTSEFFDIFHEKTGLLKIGEMNDYFTFSFEITDIYKYTLAKIKYGI